MFIVSNEESKVYKMVNLETIKEIRVNNGNIQVDFVNGTGCQIAEYHNFEDCKVAMKLLQKAIYINATLFEFPNKLKIQSEYSNMPEKVKHLDGRKTKRHGGS